MKENLSNTDKKTIGGWDAPCEAIDYGKLMENAQRQCDSLRARLAELHHSPLEPGETALSRRRTVRILTDMYYEQKSNWKLFQQRTQKKAKPGASPSSQKTGEAERSASPVLSTCSEKKSAKVSPPNPVPPAKSEVMAERLLASLTSRRPCLQKKSPVPPLLRRQDGRQERR